MIAKLRKFIHWMQRRNPKYIILRLTILLKRYSITSAKARKRTLDCVHLLAHHHCSPSFPTPGRVVLQNAAFCREIQHLGAELSVHGYHHVDFHSLSQEEATAQFKRAIQAYTQSQIESHGFRCPYLSYSDRLLDAIPDGMFSYSSNKAIVWDVIPPQHEHETAIFESLSSFYHAAPADTTISMPYFITPTMVEIPASIPDDLQIYDGLKLGETGLTQLWGQILRKTYLRGEVFVVLFHPESFYLCANAFETLLTEAYQLRPPIWVARLRDIAAWWKEKATFTTQIIQDSPDHLTLRFECTDRATILLRHLTTTAPTQPWHGSYQLLEDHTCRVAAHPRPFIGLMPDVPPHHATFLREQGYILETGANAAECSICLDAATLERLAYPTQIIAFIEGQPVPLVRYWPWPNRHRSALSLTGDLDALSLLDYAARLLPW